MVRYGFGIVLVLILAALSGCAAPAYRSADVGVVAGLPPAAPELTTSLFASDKAVLSGEDIDTILSSTITLPEAARLVVIKFNPGGGYYASPEFAALDKEYNDRFLAALDVSPRVSDARLLPSMLTPKDMSIPYLREAAARFQSELLLIYRTGTQSYTRYNALSPDETRSYCMVEAVLLHVRTGIVVYSGVQNEDYVTRTTSQDTNTWESTQRAERAATEKAMMRLAADVVAFLQNVPLPD